MEKHELDDPILLRDTVWQHNKAVNTLALHVDAISKELAKHGILVPLPEWRKSDQTDELRE